MLGNSDHRVLSHQIDEGWITDALRGSGALTKAEEVSSFTMDPLDGGHGETGSIFRLALTGTWPASSDAPSTLILKRSTSNEALRERARQLGAYEREATFYTSFAAASPIRSPRCHAVHLSDDATDTLLLLEDFPDHLPGDEVTGCTPEQAVLALEGLAGHHAQFWESPLLDTTKPFMSFDRRWLDQGWAGMMTDFGHLVPAWLRDLEGDFLAAVPVMQEWVRSAPRTLVHGDFRLDNMLFAGRSSADPFVAIDWQGAHPARSVQDVAYLLCHCMPTQTRREHEERLLRTYHAALVAHGVDRSWDDIHADYRRCVLYLFSYVVSIAGVMRNDHERAMRRKSELVSRAVAALADWDASDLLGGWQ